MLKILRKTVTGILALVFTVNTSVFAGQNDKKVAGGGVLIGHTEFCAMITTNLNGTILGM